MFTSSQQKLSEGLNITIKWMKKFLDESIINYILFPPNNFPEAILSSKTLGNLKGFIDVVISVIQFHL